MEDVVLQRLNKALRFFGLSNTLLAGFLKINPSTLISKLNGTRGMDIDTLCIILNYYPQLSTEWLFRGVEPMMTNMKKNTTIPESADQELRDMYIEQAKEVRRLEMRIIELEEKKKEKRDRA